MNKVILLGRLTKDPDIRMSNNENLIAKFSLAVNRRYVKPGEERQTDFISIVAYSKLAEFVNKYLTQGIQICISGRLQIRNYEDNNGIKRYASEVIAEEINFADSYKKADESILNASTPVNKTNKQETTTESSDDIIFGSDDLPF